MNELIRDTCMPFFAEMNKKLNHLELMITELDKNIQSRLQKIETNINILQTTIQHNSKIYDYENHKIE